MKEGFLPARQVGAFAALFVGLALWAFLDLLVVWSGLVLVFWPFLALLSVY
jgi:hypothetical protein